MVAELVSMSVPTNGKLNLELPYKTRAIMAGLTIENCMSLLRYQVWLMHSSLNRS